MAKPKGPVRTQSMLFTIFGDYVYVRYRGSKVWIGTLIKVLNELGFSEQAIRLALSRMCQKGWLIRERYGSRSYYSLSNKSNRLMAESEKRIFPAFRRNKKWDNNWYLVIYSNSRLKRTIKEELRKELSWLGFGVMGREIWISPYDYVNELKRALGEMNISTSVEIFEAVHLGLADSKELVSKCWDLDAVNKKYRQFIEKWEPRCRQFAEQQGDFLDQPGGCFVERVMLNHEYRKFPFVDPELPLELLPSNWLGERAAELFDQYSQMLLDQAYHFFDSVFERKE